MLATLSTKMDGISGSSAKTLEGVPQSSGILIVGMMPGTATAGKAPMWKSGTLVILARGEGLLRLALSLLGEGDDSAD